MTIVMDIDLRDQSEWRQALTICLCHSSPLCWRIDYNANERTPPMLVIP